MIINSDYSLVAEIEGYRIRYITYYTKDAWNGNPRVEITDIHSETHHTFVMNLNEVEDLVAILRRISTIHSFIPSKDTEKNNERFTD